MEDTSRIKLNGYSFDADMGIEAKKEQRAIEYLQKQLDMNVPATVMKVYKQIISQKLFHTQVGYEFLKGLQNYLYTNPEIDNSDIDTIEIDSAEEALEVLNAAREKRGEKAKKAKGGRIGKNDYKTKSQIFMATTIILAVTVVAMFIITLTAKVPTIVNYRRVLNNEYAQMKALLMEEYGINNPIESENQLD